MPASFRYINNETGEAGTIKVMDHLICEALGMQEHEKYAHGFDLLAYVGIGILMRSGGYKVTKEAFDQYLGKIRADPTTDTGFLEYTQENEATWRRFMYEEYTFEAWR